MLATHVVLICQCVIVLSQYVSNDAFRADITFDEHNDRFDVADIIGEQNRHFQVNDYDEESARRSFIRLPIIETLKNILSKPVLKNRRTQDFAYHDNMEDTYDQENEDAIRNYEKNLDKFRPQNNRRLNLLYNSLVNNMKYNQ